MVYKLYLNKDVLKNGYPEKKKIANQRDWALVPLQFQL